MRVASPDARARSLLIFLVLVWERVGPLSKSASRRCLPSGSRGCAISSRPALQHHARGQLASYALLLCAAAGWAVSIVFLRAHRFQTSTLALAPWQMLVAVVLLLPLATALEGRLPPVTIRAMAVLSYVGPITTGSPTGRPSKLAVPRATTMFVVLLAVPGLGLLLSAIALHESIDVSLSIGILLIGTGIQVVTHPTHDEIGLAPRRPARTEL